MRRWHARLRLTAGRCGAVDRHGHARRDIGVPRFLDPPERERVISIGLLEADAPADEAPDGAFDAVFRTPGAAPGGSVSFAAAES